MIDLARPAMESTEGERYARNADWNERELHLAEISQVKRTEGQTKLRIGIALRTHFPASISFAL